MGEDANRAQPDVDIEGDANIVGDNNVAIVAKVSARTVGDIMQVAGDYYASAEFWDDLKAFVGGHWIILLALCLVNGALLVLYPTLRSRYLIPPLMTLVIALLGSGAMACLYALATRGWRGRPLRIASGVVAALLVGTLAWQLQPTIRPRKFAAHTFGVAVAYFGEGAQFLPSRRGAEVTHELRNRLGGLSESQEEGEGVSIAVREIGLVRSSDEAKRWGHRLRADLVVWGWLVMGEAETATVHFELVELPASARSPEGPRVLPIGYAYSGDFRGEPADIRGLQHLGLERALVGQSNAIANFVLGLAFYLEQRSDEAIAPLEAALAALKIEGADVQGGGADPALVHYYLGKSYQMLGRAEDSVRELELAASANTGDPAAQLGLAYAYRVLEREEEAQAALQAAVRLCHDVLDRDPDSEEAWYDLGLAYEVLGEDGRALDTYLALIEANPDFSIAYLSAGRIYASQGAFDEALQMYDQGIERAQDAGYNGAWGYMDKGDVYFQQGEIISATKAYSTAVTLEPQQAWMHLRMARVYEVQGEIDLAWEAYERVVALAANRAWSNQTLGDFLLGQQLFDLAIERYRKARLYDPESAIPSIRLGRAYLLRYRSAEGQPSDAEQAEAAFEDALSQLPEDSPARFSVYAHRGQLRFYQERFESAIADFVNALAIDPQSVEIQFSLARAYEAAGETQEACAAYRAFLALDVALHDELAAHAEERVAALCED